MGGGGKLAGMPLVENCIVNSGRAARENRWRKTVHIKVEKCLKCALEKKKKSPTAVFHCSQPSQGRQIGIIAFEGSNLDC